jgi:hypothetical protein
MSRIGSYTVSCGDSIEAILLERRHSSHRGLSEERSRTDVGGYVSLERISRRQLLQDVSNTTGVLQQNKRPAEEEEKPTARSRYHQLRSEQKFTSSSSHSTTKAVLSASREVALKWLEMGNSPNHNLVQPPAPPNSWSRPFDSSAASMFSPSLQKQVDCPPNVVQAKPLVVSHGETHGSMFTMEPDRTRWKTDPTFGNPSSRVGVVTDMHPILRGKEPTIFLPRCYAYSTKHLWKQPARPTCPPSHQGQRLAYDYTDNDRCSRKCAPVTTSLEHYCSERVDHRTQQQQQQQQHHHHRHHRHEQHQNRDQGNSSGQRIQRQKERTQVQLDSLSSSEMSNSAKSHWKSAVDQRTGREYFYHEITRETQWRKPMDLASDEERRTMEEKERKQKDFFSAMESNILNSMSQGVVPGPSKQPSIARRKSSRKQPPLTGADEDERPELVRTISTMDETVLRDLIRRQPSFRNVKKTGSLTPSDLEPTKRSSAISAGDFESFMSIKSDKERLDPLEESAIGDNDSMPELFSYLPDEDPGNYSASDGSIDFDDSMRSDGGKFNESSITGFGLTWEETRALKKLASITKEMIDADNDDGYDLDNEFPIASTEKKTASGATPSWDAKDSKATRNLPREIEFSDDDSDSDLDSPAKMMTRKDNAMPASAFQKAKDMGGRELDFDDSDDSESESDLAPTPVVRRKSVRVSDETKSPKGEEEKRPEVKRRNTCGTLYVGTTMSAPDKDATIKVGRSTVRIVNGTFLEVFLNSVLLCSTVCLWCISCPHSVFGS